MKLIIALLLAGTVKSQVLLNTLRNLEEADGSNSDGTVSGFGLDLDDDMINSLQTAGIPIDAAGNIESFSTGPGNGPPGAHRTGSDGTANDRTGSQSFSTGPGNGPPGAHRTGSDGTANDRTGSQSFSTGPGNGPPGAHHYPIQSTASYIDEDGNVINPTGNTGTVNTGRLPTASYIDADGNVINRYIDADGNIIHQTNTGTVNTGRLTTVSFADADGNVINRYIDAEGNIIHQTNTGRLPTASYIDEDGNVINSTASTGDDTVIKFKDHKKMKRDARKAKKERVRENKYIQINEAGCCQYDANNNKCASWDYFNGKCIPLAHKIIGCSRGFWNRNAKLVSGHCVKK